MERWEQDNFLIFYLTVYMHIFKIYIVYIMMSFMNNDEKHYDCLFTKSSVLLI